MAKSARASNIKKNKSRLKSRVFGPVELARAERMNKKLLEIAQLARPSHAHTTDAGDMQVRSDAATNDVVTANAEGRSNTAIKKAREAKKSRIEKKKFRKEKNRIAFKKHPSKNNR